MSEPACADTTASEFRPPAQIRGLGVARTFVVALASPSDAATRLVASFQLPSMPYRHEASTWARPQARRSTSAHVPSSRATRPRSDGGGNVCSKSLPTPDGCHSVTPYLIVNAGQRALEYYKQAFGASGSFGWMRRVERSDTPRSRSATRA